MADYLVTGGAGFIGSNLTDKLVQAGHKVAVLDDLSSGYMENVNAHARVIVGDVRDASTVRAAVGGCAAIFHLAASVGNVRSIENPIEDATVNVLGTLNVLEAARTANVQKVIFSSSAATFGELKALPIGEDHPQDPDSPYGVSKLAAEKACCVYNKLYGMQNVCLRYFNVFGPRQRFDAYGNVIPIFGELGLAGRQLTVYGDGDQTRDFVHVGDVVDANVAAAGLSEGGVFNIGSGERHSVNELIAFLGELVPGGVRVVSAPARAGEVRDSVANIAAARERLAYSPDTDLRGNLGDYLTWLKNDPLSGPAAAAHRD